LAFWGFCSELVPTPGGRAGADGCRRLTTNVPVASSRVACNGVPASMRASASAGAKTPAIALVRAPRTVSITKMTGRPDAVANWLSVALASPGGSL